MGHTYRAQIWDLYVWLIYQHSYHHKSNCQKVSLARPQIWDLYVWPICQHSHHHKRNRQKVSTAHPQICHLCMYDPYTSTHTTKRETAKKCQQLTPRFATSVCMTHIPALTPSTKSPKPKIFRVLINITIFYGRIFSPTTTKC